MTELILRRIIELLIASNCISMEDAEAARKLAIQLTGADQGNIVEEDPINYKTINGKWWLHYWSHPVRPLSDEEAAVVIWDGTTEDAQPDVDTPHDAFP